MRMTPSKLPEVKTNIIDKTIAVFSPQRAAKRYRARMMLAMAGGYAGASRTRRSLKQWTPSGYDADSDILPDLPTLRDRSRDMIRNMPLASGAMNTKVTNVVGTGLRLQARIDREALNLDEAQADAWESKTEREWRLWWDSFDCDAARTLRGDGLTTMVYRQALENGDVFVLLPRISRKTNPYTLALQTIEADRVSNPDNQRDTATLSGGIEKDKHGAPTAYHVMNAHPGRLYGSAGNTWQRIPAYGQKLGLKNILHIYRPTRPGQSRGVPDLAAVIEPLKQLTRYAEAELMAAVVSAMFTVFVETETGDPTFDLTDMSGETGSSTSDDDYKLGNGSIIGLAPGEKIHDSNPGRPNAAFDPFTQAILRQIGVAIELPFELLVKHFTASYSAARAALLEAWKYFSTQRKWMTDHFNRVVYEIWMYEAVSSGRIVAPGFFTDPIIRQAYLGSVWIGPAKGQIDELKEIKAAELRVDMGVSTLSEVTAEMTGGDWEKKHPQSVKEHNARKDAGLITETVNNGDLPDENF